MATNRKFNVRHGLSAGTGPTQKDVVNDVGTVLDVGVLTSLTTTAKTNVVAAINEVNDGNAKIDDVIALAIALG
jgi:glutamate synthase domain-containing protein 2